MSERVQREAIRITPLDLGAQEQPVVSTARSRARCVACHAGECEVSCRGCKATYHKECLGLLKRRECATLGCSETFAPSQKTEQVETEARDWIPRREALIGLSVIVFSVSLILLVNFPATDVEVFCASVFALIISGFCVVTAFVSPRLNRYRP
jgi:hypothetical protein